jgi:hypothetical protein
MGSVGDCHVNAPAESVIELYKTKLIRRWSSRPPISKGGP